MKTVKGTKQYPVKVVEHRPLLRFGVFFILSLVVVAAVSGAHYLGRSEGSAGQSDAMAELQKAREELTQTKSQATSLEQRLANINLGAEVDKAATEEIRQEVIALKDQIAKLEEENTFYRGLMAPSEDKKGLTFGAVELSRKERSRTYAYKVVLQQLATNHQLLSGSLRYRVIGRFAGEDRVYNLHELSDSITREAIRLRFKYFQTVQGELQLPEGFEPQAIELVAQASGRNPVTVEKRFGWLAEEVL